MIIPLRSILGFIILTIAMTMGAGCHIFERKLYQQLGDGGSLQLGDGSIGGHGSPDGASEAGTSFDLSSGMAPDGGPSATPLCGRASPPSLCPAGYLFCDGFEDESTLSFTHWSSTLSDNLTSGGLANLGTGMTVETSPTCLGQHSFHAATVGRNQESVLLRTYSGWANPLHVRFFLYIKQHMSSVGLLEFRNSPGDFTSLFLDPPTASTPTSRFGVETIFSNSLPSIGPELALAHDTWLCVELTVRFDSNSGEVNLQVDGNPVGDLVGLQTDSPSKPMDRMALGPVVEDTGDTTSSNEVFYDEVAVSADPIGCM
jgi:hypothetical protein